uniref:Mitochondrial carrier protein n=1 Tax=Romanomermis culicivorax TaxID=13658 RepID=A0A915I1U5_ROMCU
MSYRDAFPTGNTQFPLAVVRRNPQVGRTQRETWHPQLNVFGNFFVAGCAAVPARVAVHPFSVMRACAGAGLPGHKMGPVQAAYWMLKVEGRNSFLKAVIPSAIKSFPQIGLQFSIYGELSKKIVPDVPYGKYSWMGIGGNFIAGAVAGTVTQSLLQPFDVIKTRLCVQGFRSKNVYEGALDCAHKIVVKDGLAGLYKGFLPSVTISIPNLSTDNYRSCKLDRENWW